MSNFIYIRFNLLIKNFLYHIKRDRNIILTSLAIGVIFTFFIAVYTSRYAYAIQTGIANEVVRFHVLANSDTEADQLLKLQVRDRVLGELDEYLDMSENKTQTRQILYDNLANIEKWANDEIKKNGYNYTVTVSLENMLFPTVRYGNASFPAGRYDALRIEIGQAEGQNWWCIMFPPLCFVDVAQGEISPEDQELMRDILTEEEYQIIMQGHGDDLLPQIKFKVVEWWQEK